jgi:hypothetical protein
MCHQISQPHHATPIRLAADDLETAQPSLPIIQPRKDAISREKKILSKKSRESRGAKIFRPNHRDRDESKTLVSIDLQSFRHERMENSFRKSERHSDHALKPRYNRKRVATQVIDKLSHASLLLKRFHGAKSGLETFIHPAARRDERTVRRGNFAAKAN